MTPARCNPNPIWHIYARYATLFFALLCFAMLCYALVCVALLCVALIYIALLCFALLCFALLRFATLFFALLAAKLKVRIGAGMCRLPVKCFGWIFCLPSSLSLRLCPDWGWNVSIACVFHHRILFLFHLLFLERDVFGI